MTFPTATTLHLKPRESQEQTLFFKWLEVLSISLNGAAPFNVRDYAYSIPNGGSRHRFEAWNLKRQGVTAGVPDICIPIHSGGQHALYIEMKRAGGKPTELQLEKIAALRLMENAAVICEGFDAARRETVKYLSKSWLVTDRWIG